MGKIEKRKCSKIGLSKLVKCLETFRTDIKFSREKVH